MTVRTLNGDCRAILPTLAAEAFDCIVTSPPYWGLRDYGVDGQIGLEGALADYVEALRQVGAELRRVLKPSGTFWLNLGDSYAMSTRGSSGKGEKQISNAGTLLADRSGKIPAGLKPKDLCLVPERVAMALQADGWFLRSQIIWHKPNPMPESVTDRPTSAHERVFLLTKSERYFYDAAAISEEATYAGKDINLGDKSMSRGQALGAGVAASGNALKDVYTVPARRNARNVWTIASQPYSGAHFATMPPALVERCLLAGCPGGGTCARPIRRRGHNRPCRRSIGPRRDADRTQPRLCRIAAQPDRRRRAVVC